MNRTICLIAEYWCVYCPKLLDSHQTLKEVWEQYDRQKFVEIINASCCIFFSTRNRLHKMSAETVFEKFGLINEEK